MFLNLTLTRAPATATASVLHRAEKDCVIAFTLIVTNPPGPNRALTGKGNDRGEYYAARAHRYRVQKGIST
jgi:hypothetical protein